jgi:hypothetical protein
MRPVRPFSYGEDFMRTSIKGLVSVAALSAMLVTGVCIGQAMADQPHMVNALNSLVAARDELVVASRNKGGHRVEALRLTNAAIAEVQAGMADAAD